MSTITQMNFKEATERVDVLIVPGGPTQFIMPTAQSGDPVVKYTKAFASQK